MGGMVHTCIGLIVVLGPLCACPKAAARQGADKEAGGKVKVTIIVILASEGKPEVDKRLAKIAPEIQRRNPNLKRFRLKSINYRSLAVDEKATFKLVDEKQAYVIVKQAADKSNRVGLAITAPDQGEITYRTVCGKFLPIVTRYETRMKERLILAVRVQPCNGD